MQIQIHLIEEILVPAIEDQGQIAVFQAVDLFDHCVVAPAFGELLLFAQLPLHLPRIGEGTDIHTSRGGTRRTEPVPMVQCNPPCAVATHAQSRDGPFFTHGQGRIAGINPVDQLLRDEGLELRAGIERTVPVPAVFAVGADQNHTETVGQTRQVGDSEPREVRSAVTVQQIERREAMPLAGRIGKDHHGRNFTLHFGAEDRHGINPRSLGGHPDQKGCRQKKNSLHHCVCCSGPEFKKGAPQRPDTIPSTKPSISSPAGRWSHASAYRPSCSSCGNSP